MIVAVPFAAALLGAAPRPAALAAAPARITLTGARSETIRLTNSGRGVATIDAAPAGFALDLRGRPRILPHADAVASRVRVRPRRLALRPGEVSTVAVSVALPAGAHPGDHPALVLLTTEPQPGAGLGVRMQIGIVAIVHVPGPVTRRLVLRGLRVRRVHDASVLVLFVRNRGDVTEQLTHDRVRVSLRRRGRVIARLEAGPRELFPHAEAAERFRYRGRVRGAVTALVELVRGGDGVATIRRTFRIRL